MSDDKKMWEWSPRHVRLRYEMFLVSITIFLIGRYDVTKFKLSPVELTEKAEIETPAFWVLSGYFIFLGASYISRSKYEIDYAKGVHFEIDKMMTDFRESLISVAELPKLQELHLEKINRTLKTVITEAQKTTKEFKKSHELTLETVTKLRNLSQMKLDGIKKTGHESEKYILKDAGELVGRYNSQLNRMKDIPSMFQEESLAFKNNTRTLIDLDKGLRTSIDKFEQKIKNLQFNKTFNDKIHRNFISLWAPGLATLVIFILGCMYQFKCLPWNFSGN